NQDLLIMKELGFNIEEIDIDGKNKNQLEKLFANKDIIFVEGGNTFYLLKAIRKSGFEKVIRKLLKKGTVYIGASAGSIVAGKTIKTAGWLGDKNIAKIGNLKGMNLVPFDIFVHYRPEHEQIIKKKLPWKWQRRKLKILTDEQAILAQGSDRILIGRGEAVKL
ncbi:MAG: Type 1 glutamine amidotransferase-like domain-containing protein, partial [Patescibacteria group bacterium]